MQQTAKKSTRNRRPSMKTFKVSIDGHTLNLTAEQITADKSGWTACHGKVGDTEVRSLSIKQMGNKLMVKDGQGRLAGCYDTNEFAVMAKKFLSTTDANTISIGAQA